MRPLLKSPPYPGMDIMKPQGTRCQLAVRPRSTNRRNKRVRPEKQGGLQHGMNIRTRMVRQICLCKRTGTGEGRGLFQPRSVSLFTGIVHSLSRRPATLTPVPSVTRTARQHPLQTSWPRFRQTSQQGGASPRGPSLQPCPRDSVGPDGLRPATRTAAALYFVGE